MRVLLLLCALEALLLSGCRKKTNPEFYTLESQQSVLISRDGDDAYVSSEMATVISGLEAIPEDSVEKPRAASLVTKLTAEQARVKAERVPFVRPPPSEKTPPPVALEPPTPSEPDEPAADQADAGPPPVVQPWPGMEEKVFLERYAACFSGPSKTTLPDGKPGTQYALKASADCQKQYGAKDTRLSYLFTDKGLWGKAAEVTSVVDAGTLLIPGPPNPPPPPPPPPIITTPGAPMPEGYEKAP